MVRPGWRGIPLLAAAALALSGCALPNVQEMNFRVDNRLQFLSPKARSEPAQPVTLRWRMRDFTVAGPGAGPVSPDRGYFAIFVDRQPIKPGQTMAAVAAGDQFCVHTAGCPNAAYLAQRQVYTTTGTSYTLPVIAALPDDNDAVQLHTVVIVLMNTAGHRIGESYWELDVRLRNQAA